MPELIPYDEFGLFHENAAEYGIPFDGPPDVQRVEVEVDPGRSVSSLLWGARTGPPELVLVHGGAQNAHTWDTVALALGPSAPRRRPARPRPLRRWARTAPSRPPPTGGTSPR